MQENRSEFYEVKMQTILMNTVNYDAHHSLQMNRWMLSLLALLQMEKI